MLISSIPLPGGKTPPTLTAEPLTREAFAPFGDVLSNPHPSVRPNDTPVSAIAAYGAVPTNQGTAIQYRGLGRVRDLYPARTTEEKNANANANADAAPASPRSNVFVCGTRAPLAVPGTANDADADADADTEADTDAFEVRLFERHPFTTQTFVPLGAAPGKWYLVVVAPSLAASAAEEDLPAPTPPPAGSGDAPTLPGRGLPDVKAARAFLATGAQAVTYGAGTWHAPMMALGPADATVDFVVFQFASDVPAEDCQEVTFKEEGEGGKENPARIVIRVSRSLFAQYSKL
ncbi:ureidoglycolate hydrolase [Xylariaceae sp. FL0662B]|nr:ureidoglycolate hydrolase [Xylariaceae sp. FL0662B]